MSAANRSSVVRLAERMYALLLALYPRSFLREFKSEMVQAFSELASAEYSRGGSGAVVALVVRSVVDTGRYAAVEHVTAR